MNNTRIYEHLQNHYQKLSARLSKAQDRGRSQSFIQQLQGRLQRCSMQLKQLGAGVAVLAALGLSTPAVGQAPLPFEFASPNPFDTINLTSIYDYPEFVDLDGDGDLDMISTGTYSSTGVRYYKNVGNAANPAYILQTGANSPFPSFTRDEQYSAFVDVDGDGDLDMFATPYDYYNSNAAIYYYENTGSATNPAFTLRLNTADNPLSDAAVYVNSIVPSSSIRNLIYLSFVDIDNDGDSDCFIVPYTNDGINGPVWPSNLNSERILYYKNEGTTTVPDFQRQMGTANPLNGLALIPPNNTMFVRKLLFIEGSKPKDSDFDVFSITSNTPYYYENTGSITNPTFSAVSYNVLDIAYTKTNQTTNIEKVNSVRLISDIDADGRLEVVLQDGSTQFYLEDTSAYINIQQLAKAEHITVYPNPTTGLLQLEQPLTGTAYIYNAVGQELYTKELEQDQQLDISHLPQGTYFLYIRTKEQDYQQTIRVQE